MLIEKHHFCPPWLIGLSVQAVGSLILAVVVTGRGAFSDESPNAPERLLHLVSVIQRDYAHAVRRGQIVSKIEYREAIEGANVLMDALSELPMTREEALALVPEIKQLIKKIEQKELNREIERMTRKIQETVLKRWREPEAPPIHRSQLKSAKNHFKNACGACHGVQGRADGPITKKFRPQPEDFRDLKHLTLKEAYLAVKFGMPGTAMPGFEGMNSQELWGLARYVLRLRDAKSSGSVGKRGKMGKRAQSIRKELAASDG